MPPTQDERIVCRLAGPAEVQNHIVRISPQIEVTGDELRALIDADSLRIANLAADSFQRYRRADLASRLLCVTGKVQREDLVIHLIADKLDDYTALLSGLSDIAVEGDFDGNFARADEVRKPVREIQVVIPPSGDFR